MYRISAVGRKENIPRFISLAIFAIVALCLFSYSPKIPIPPEIPNSIEREHLCNIRYKNPNAENKLHIAIRLLRSFPYPIDFLDIGANIGKVSIPALTCLPVHHNVLAVEPVKKNLAAILGNSVDIHAPLGTRRWQVVRTVLSDSDGHTTIFIPGKRGDNAAISKETSIANIGVSMNEVYNESVPMMRGDTLLKRFDFSPSLIKVDVQGVEYMVFKGLKTFLSSNRDIIVVSEHHIRSMRVSGVDPTYVFRLMKQYGFKAFCDPKIKIKAWKPFVFGGTELKSADGLDVRAPCDDIVYFKYKTRFLGVR